MQKVPNSIDAVNLVMDRVAKRSRGFAFLRYSNEEESRKAIEGMHGKVLFSLGFANFMVLLDIQNLTEQFWPKPQILKFYHQGTSMSNSAGQL